MIKYLAKEHEEDVFQRNVFDSSIIAYLQEFGTVACLYSMKKETIFIYEVSYPSQLDVKLLKRCLKYWDDDHVMCHLKKKSYLVELVRTADPLTPAKKFQSVDKLLDTVEMKRLWMSFPRYTAKGVAAIAAFHVRCVAENIHCSCQRMLDEYKNSVNEGG